MKTKAERQKIINDGIKEVDIRKVFQQGWKVDKSKIRYIVNNIEEVQELIYNLTLDSRIKVTYQSNCFEKSNKNYVIELEKGTVYIGVGSNAPKGVFSELQKSIVVEYNPQKIDIFKEIKYLRFLKSSENHRRKIMYLDLAYDMHVTINDTDYIKRRIAEYECVISHKEKETIYLKTFGRNGSTRIYNKTLEHNGGTKEEDEDEEYLNKNTGEVRKKTIKYIGDCTRYEIRIKPKNNEDLEEFAIEKLVKLHQLSLKDNENEMLREMEQESPTVFRNLYMIHIGKINMVEKNKKKEYLNKYDEIKKRTLRAERTNVFENFNTNKLKQTIDLYLDYIIQVNKSKFDFIDLEEKEENVINTTKYNNKENNKKVKKELKIEEENENVFNVKYKGLEKYSAENGIFLYCNLKEN
jgi:hypothetical protein